MGSLLPLSHNLHIQVTRPFGLIHAVRSCANIVPQSHTVFELRYWFHLDELMSDSVRLATFEELGLEQCFRIVFGQETKHFGEEVMHGMVMAEDWRAVTSPDIGPYLLPVCSHRFHEPLRVVVERGLQKLVI